MSVVELRFSSEVVNEKSRHVVQMCNDVTYIYI